MSAKILPAIDQFYWLMIGVLLILSLLVIFTAKEIFSALNTADQIDETLLGSTPRVDKTNLDKAQELFFNREIIHLDEAR